MDNSDILMKLGQMDGKLDLLVAREVTTDERLHAVEKKVWYGSALAAAFAIFAAKLGFPLNH
jgi:hypothetical protein